MIETVVADLDVGLANPWYIPAVVAYSASNKPDAVPFVFRFVLEELKAKDAPVAEQFLLAQKMREALLKAGLTSGYPRVGGTVVSSLLHL